MTAFRRLGFARKFKVFGRTVVRWEEGDTPVQPQKREVKSAPMAATNGNDASAGRASLKH
jgi:hypothetical protein